MGFESALAIALHKIGKHRVEQQWDMTKQVVKHIRFHDVVKLFGLANPVGDGELTIRQ